jgi:hypothetical protein
MKQDVNLVMETPESTMRQWRDHLTTEREEAIRCGLTPIKLPFRNYFP